MALVKAASTSELKPGSARIIEAEGEPIALFNVDGEFYAVSNECPHMGGPLGEGSLDGAVVTCPWHGWRFNVKTGVSPVVPTAKVKTYKVVVQGNDVFVEV